MAKELHTPFRYDFVGSFLRPEALKKARLDFAAGTLDEAGLKAVEDETILDLIRKQKELGYHVITDGEFRRATWHLDFMWAFDGITHAPTKTGLPFAGEAAMIDDTWVIGKVKYKGQHPFLDHFRFVKAQEDENTVAKLTIPAPAQFLAQFDMAFSWPTTHKIYGDEKELIEDIVAAYQAFLKDLYAAGCRNLQLDDCTWGMLVDPHRFEFFGTDQAGIDAICEKYVAINNAVIDGTPEDMYVNTHVCRGNFHSTYAASGGYDGVAKFLLQNEHVDAFYLEYDTERAGGFEPLDFVPEGKKVVLGLITTKTPELENKKHVIFRIQQASTHLPLDRLCLSPQCGFASCEIGNKLTEEQQWNKLKLVREIADEVWK